MRRLFLLSVVGLGSALNLDHKVAVRSQSSVDLRRRIGPLAEGCSLTDYMTLPVELYALIDLPFGAMLERQFWIGRVRCMDVRFDLKPSALGALLADADRLRQPNQ